MDEKNAGDRFCEMLRHLEEKTNTLNSLTNGREKFVMNNGTFAKRIFQQLKDYKIQLRKVENFFLEMLILDAKRISQEAIKNNNLIEKAGIALDSIWEILNEYIKLAEGDSEWSFYLAGLADKLKTQVKALDESTEDEVERLQSIRNRIKDGIARINLSRP